MRASRTSGRVAAALVLLVALAACLPSPPPGCDVDFSVVRSPNQDQCPLPPPPPDDCTDCAAASADPHLHTFDGHRYDLQAVGELTAVLADDGLEVQLRTGPVHERASAVTAAALSVDGARLTVTASDDGPVVRKDGREVALSAEEGIALGSGRAGLDPDGRVVVEWPDGTLVVIRAWQTFLDVFVDLADARRGEVVGLLGDADGDPADDVRTRTGEQLDPRPEYDVLYGTFAESWRVTDDTSLFDYGDGESTATFTDRDFPGEVVTLADLDPDERAAAEAVCREAGVTDPVILDDCTLDVALTGDEDFAEAAAERQAAFDADRAVGAGDGVRWVTVLEGVTPTETHLVDDGAGHVLVQVVEGGAPLLVALDVADGGEAWRLEGVARDCPALPLPGGRVAVMGTGTGPLAVDGRASLSVIDGTDGRVLGQPLAPETGRFDGCRWRSVLVDGIGLFDDGLALHAVDLTTTDPALLWSRPHPSRPTTRYAVEIDDGRIVFGEQDPERGVGLFLLDLATGEELHRLAVPGDFFAEPSTLVAVDGVAAVTTQEVTTSETAGHLLAVVPADGDRLELAWEREILRRSDDPDLQAPLVGTTAIDGLLVGRSGDRLVALDPTTGEAVWTHEPVRESGRAPAADDEGNAYDTAGDPWLIGVSSTGALEWSLPADDVLTAGSQVGAPETLGPILGDQLHAAAVAIGNRPVIVAVGLP